MRSSFHNHVCAARASNHPQSSDRQDGGFGYTPRHIVPVSSSIYGDRHGLMGRATSTQKKNTFTFIEIKTTTDCARLGKLQNSNRKPITIRKRVLRRVVVTGTDHQWFPNVFLGGISWWLKRHPMLWKCGFKSKFHSNYPRRYVCNILAINVSLKFQQLVYFE